MTLILSASIFNILSWMHNWEFFFKMCQITQKNYMHRQNFTWTEQILHVFMHVTPLKSSTAYSWNWNNFNPPFFQE